MPAPEGYTRLPLGVRCRCWKLYQESPTQFWCCNAQPVVVAPTPSTHISALDGTVRQNHYGSGRQPWDDIKERGWAVGFAAGNILKYLRRGKDIEHSKKSARWYWAELHKLNSDDASDAIHVLSTMLTADELAILNSDS